MKEDELQFRSPGPWVQHLVLFVGQDKEGSPIRQLDRQAYEVLVVDEQNAIERMESGPEPGLVLVQLDGTGDRVRRLVRASAVLGGRIPVVACCDSEDEVPIAVAAGADDFIVTASPTVFRSRFQTVMRQRAQSVMLRDVLDSTFDGIVTIDRHGVITGYNKAAARIFGFSVQEVWGKNVSILMPPEERARHDHYLGNYLTTGQSAIIGVGRDVIGQRKNGERFPLFLQLSHIREHDDEFIVAVLKDRSLELRNQSLQHEANHDALTGLPNRRYLRSRLARITQAMADDPSAAAVLFIDLDHFKDLNDTQGHEAGDQLLTQIALRLSQNVRTSDTVARLSGDEFVVLIERLDASGTRAAEEAALIAEKLRRAINEPLTLQAHRYRCRASIGVALLAKDDSPEEAIKKADTAMYEAKRSGRNSICIYDPQAHARVGAQRSLEADLRLALPEGQFQLHLQPQVDAHGVIFGAEALLRWFHPKRGLIAPADFIPLAEDSGVITDIGHWVLETACRLLRRWSDDPALKDLRLAINVSARQFREPNFMNQVLAAIQHAGIGPDRLELELTESLVMANIGDTLARIHALRRAGLRFSVDDFGTGHSSLSYLTRLPLDQLKIDRSFVHNMTVARSDAVIVQTIIGMAKSLGLDVVAEGVETPEQRAFLIENGCSKFQGFLFDRPMPIDLFEQRFSAAGQTVP